MRNTLDPLRLGSLLALASLAACADGAVVAPRSAPAARATDAVTTTTTDEEVVAVSPGLAAINAQLAAAGSKLRVTKAHLIMDALEYDGVSATTLIADDRYRGIDGAWVPGDPRRDGRLGVTYAIATSLHGQPVTRNADGTNLHPVDYAELETQVEGAIDAWRGQTCSTAPLTRVGITPGTNPDIVDELVLGTAPAGYAQPADIVEAGWLPATWFRTLAGGTAGNGIIGVTFNFNFVDGSGNETDIDGNHKGDIGLAEIYYNQRFAWGSTLAANVVDFYHILTHETGHSLGLGHFGKVFVTKTDAADGIAITDIKYAPRAIMNAVYVTGRGQIEGTDQSSFCILWGAAR